MAQRRYLRLVPSGVAAAGGRGQIAQSTDLLDVSLAAVVVA